MLDAIANAPHSDTPADSTQLQPYSSFSGNGGYLTSLDSTSLDHLLSFDALADAAAPGEPLRTQNSLQVEPIEEIYSPGQAKPPQGGGGGQLLSRKSSIDPFGSLEDNKQKFFGDDTQKRTASSMENADCDLTDSSTVKRSRTDCAIKDDISESLHPDIEELCRNQNVCCLNHRHYS